MKMIAYLMKKLRLLFFFKSNVRVVYKQKCKNVKHIFFSDKTFSKFNHFLQSCSFRQFVATSTFSSLYECVKKSANCKMKHH